MSKTQIVVRKRLIIIHAQWILLDSQDFGFLYPNQQKYADTRIRIQEAQPKIAKKNLFTLKTKISTIEKREFIKIFLISELFIKF